MLSRIFSPDKSAVPAPVAAARRKCAVDAAGALFAARAEAATVRNTRDAEKAALAEVERELAAAATPTTDDAEIDARLHRKERLTMKAEGHRALIAAAEENVRVCEAAVVEVQAALAKAVADLDAPPVDTVDDLPRLKAEAEKTARAAQTAAEARDGAKRGAAPALAACKAMLNEGAATDDALRILEADALARAKIAAAEKECEAADEAAGHAHDRLAALEARLEHERSSAKFNARRDRLEAQRGCLTAAIAGANEIGAHMGGLFRAGEVYVKAFARAVSMAAGGHVEGHDRWLTLNPAFAESAFVPILGDKDGRAFVSSSWRHDYSQFETPQKLLQPLLEGLKAKGAEWAVCRRAALDAFDAEYRCLGNRLLEGYAVLYLWLVERDAAFAEAGDIARGVAKPEWPLQSTMGGDFLPWRRLCLPSLRNGGAPLWEPHWPGARLLELTKTAKAA